MSDYEELPSDDDELLIVDNGEPELADEIVLDTIHSPTYAEDAVFDLALESSDFEWEFLDDYYDADPSVSETMMRKRRPSEQEPDKKKRKRSMVDNERGSPRTSSPSGKRRRAVSVDHATFPGVIWRTRSHDASPTPVVEPGTFRPVSVLKNWRDNIVRKPRKGDTTHPVSAERGGPRKKVRAEGEEVDSEGYESDVEGDRNGSPMGDLPPVSLVAADDIPREKNDVGPASQRGRRMPSRLKESFSVEDEQEGETASHVPITATAQSKLTTENPATDPRREGDSSTLSGRTAPSRGRKRKASSTHQDDVQQERNRVATAKDEGVKMQPDEQSASDPSRRSLRKRNKT